MLSKTRSAAVLIILINFNYITISRQQDCRVLADCNDGTATWKDLTNSHITKRPGKRGAPGIPGEKGEPGIEVDIAELKEQLKEENKAPVMYFYVTSLTWSTGKIYCEGLGKTLCSFDQICIPDKGARRLIIDVMPGDYWVPVIDENNDWVEIGHRHGAPCIHHTKLGSYPSWGTTTEVRTYKGYVFCCARNQEQEAIIEDMKYQYIGVATTYASSVAHCNSQNRRLCYSSEICSGNSPRFGAVNGDHWAAIKDRRNDWIQIGKSGTCKTHGVQTGLPSWGERQDNSHLAYVGFVFCCTQGSKK